MRLPPNKTQRTLYAIESSALFFISCFVYLTGGTSFAALSKRALSILRELAGLTPSGMGILARYSQKARLFRLLTKEPRRAWNYSLFSDIAILPYWFGGGEGSRTPVRKPIHRNFSERRRSIEFPHPSVGRHTPGISRVMMRGTVNSFRTHGHHLGHAQTRLVVLPGGTAAIKQRRELRYRCSLIYNCPFYGGWAPPPAYPASSSPSKPVRPREASALARRRANKIK